MTRLYASKDLLALEFDGMRLVTAREAIASLALLKPSAEPQIWHFLDARLTDHPSARCLAWRKHGEQLSDEEKRAAGLRKNAFFSREAFAELTDAGRARPLQAHDQTLLRATFTMLRYRTVISSRTQPIGPPTFIDEYEHETLHRKCEACNSLDGLVTKGDDVVLLPPRGVHLRDREFRTETEIRLVGGGTR